MSTGRFDRFFQGAILATTFCIPLQELHSHEPPSPEATSHGSALLLIQTLLRDNTEFVKSHNQDFFAPYQMSQTPRATVVMCSDSREQITDFDKKPENDLFVVRNIGNQLGTAEGSVEYGVNHLHTPVLIFIGHVTCGAVTAATEGISQLEPAIQQELRNMNIEKSTQPKASDTLIHQNVEQNVNNQVQAALKKFDQKVKQGGLMIIGMVYDFKDEYKEGFGALHLLNVNGNKDPNFIQEFKTKAQNFSMPSKADPIDLPSQSHTATP